MKPQLAYEHPRCGAVRDLLQMVGSKWPVLIVTLLSDGPKRFSELKRAVGGISQKSLTKTLRELERDGLVKRVVTPVIPPRVDYCLTPLGASLLPPIKALADWAVENEALVAAAREAFGSVAVSAPVIGMPGKDRYGAI